MSLSLLYLGRTCVARNRLQKFFSTNTFHMSLPAIPTKKLSFAGRVLEERLLSISCKIEKELGYNEDDRDDSFRTIRTIAITNQELLQSVREGNISNASLLLQENRRILEQLTQAIGADVVKRESRLSSHLERLGTAHMLLDFFSTGKLASPTTLPFCNDDEYIAASIAWAQELSRYSLQRAIDGDIASVETVRCAITELHQLLLSFDFRNGPLRRRYDGMKYFVKSVEDITYELSLIPGNSSSFVFHDTISTVGGSIDTDAAASSSAIWKYVDGAAITEIQHRMAAYDQQRELVIKESRDIQKLSKQAIFSIIRGQNADARQKLGTASNIIVKVFDIVSKAPALRPGSFSNSLEEWCEAQMLLDWCEKKSIPDFAELPHRLNATEYIGGLSDLTGELGRLAVMLAAKRESAAVHEIMEVDSLIYDCISRVNNLGSNFNKKLEAVQSNLKKVEDLVFEMNILERTGRMKKRMRVVEDGSSASGPSSAVDGDG